MYALDNKTFEEAVLLNTINEPSRLKAEKFGRFDLLNIDSTFVYTVAETTCSSSVRSPHLEKRNLLVDISNVQTTNGNSLHKTSMKTVNFC